MGTGHAAIRKLAMLVTYGTEWPPVLLKPLPAPCPIQTWLGLMHTAGPGLVLLLKWPDMAKTEASMLLAQYRFCDLMPADIQFVLM